MRPFRKVAIITGVVLAGVTTAALVAFAGIGVWLIAVVGGGLVGIAATLIAVGASGAPAGGTERAGIDPVTGLPDAARLHHDLERALDGPRHVLFNYVLDGLKPYNDAYGERCGDALLAWLARNLCDSLGNRAKVYRRRGASFGVLAFGSEHETDLVRADASAALFEIGDGFAIWASVGEVVLPAESQSPEAALERADRRAHEPVGTPAADEDPHPPRDPLEVLPRARRRCDLGELAKRVGRRLGVEGRQLDVLEAAAHLRDIGNVAVPSTVLTAPGRLPDHEWRFIELHTIVGERLIAGSFGMEDVAQIVRSSHERWDGRGYPDGLRGEEIPLASRIVFVCSAYQDMTSQRPHRRALDRGRAIHELEQAAGSQFDGRVVHAFKEELGSRHGVRRPSGAGLDAVLSAIRAMGKRDGEGSADGAEDVPVHRPMRVLLADPDPVSRFLLRREISSAGHECVAVEDGLSAFETYERMLPDAVIAATMPHLDGDELVRRIRTGETPETYLMLLVDENDSDELRRGMRSGVDDFVRRPIGHADLENRLAGAGKATAARR